MTRFWFRQHFSALVTHFGIILLLQYTVHVHWASFPGKGLWKDIKWQQSGRKWWWNGHSWFLMFSDSMRRTLLYYCGKLKEWLSFSGKNNKGMRMATCPDNFHQCLSTLDRFFMLLFLLIIILSLCTIAGQLWSCRRPIASRNCIA